MSTQMGGPWSGWVRGSPIIELLKCSWGILHFVSYQSQLTSTSMKPHSMTSSLPKIPKDLLERNLGAWTWPWETQTPLLRFQLEPIETCFYIQKQSSPLQSQHLKYVRRKSLLVEHMGEAVIQKQWRRVVDQLLNYGFYVSGNNWPTSFITRVEYQETRDLPQLSPLPCQAAVKRFLSFPSLETVRNAIWIHFYLGVG